MTGWSAPGAAYTLTAHQAMDETEQIQKLWESCTPGEQMEIIYCLAAQARAQMRLSGITHLDLKVDGQVLTAAPGLAAALVKAITALVNAEPVPHDLGTYERATIAENLADLSIAAVEKAGISRADFAVRCHSLAGTAQ